MYIKTPKRYRGTQRRQVFSCGRILLILVLMSLIVLGVGVYQMRDALRPYVEIAMATMAADANTWQATQFAPSPEPTTDPSRTLIDADNNWNAGRISIALDNYRSVLAVVPNNVDVYSRVTLAYLTRGDLDAARRYAENTVTADPFNPDAWSLRSLVYAWTGDAAQSIASAQQALALSPDNARATAFLAYAYYESDLDLARSQVETAIRLDPNAWEGYWVRGILNENVTLDIEAAISDYETAYQYASEQNPAMAGAVARPFARVLNHPNIGRRDEALEVLNNALTIDPDNVEVLFELGNIYFRDLGDYGQAQDPLGDCVRIAPENYNCWYLLGRTRFALNDLEGALSAFEEAIALDTPLARHYWWAANVEVSVGSCSQATVYLETGYDMAIEGGLPADDEGNIQLMDDFDYLMGLCRVIPISTEATEEAETEGGE